MNLKSNIPTIEFSASEAFAADFDFVDLEELYKRIPTFDFDPFSPHRVHFHHLIYISSGSGNHFIDFNLHPCHEGSFIFVNKNQIHAFDSDNRPHGLMILFTEEFLDSIRTTIRLPVFTSGFSWESVSPILTVDCNLKESCEVLLGELSKITGEASYDNLLIRLIFTSLMVKLHRERKPLETSSTSESDRLRLSLFLTLIEEDFSTTKDAKAYANKMGIAYKTLNRICKQVTHKSPKQLIDAHTILEAKRRLATEHIQVSQLAFEFGFEDVSNFVKYFKKHTLLTPSQFQQNNQG